jgi:hypothetical protein
MALARIEHAFDCDEDRLWQVALFDEEYSRRLYLETLRFPTWRILESKMDGDLFVRKVEIRPRLDDVPGPIRKIVGDQFGYVEEGTFDKAKRSYQYRMIPSKMPDRSRIVGRMYTEQRGPGRCARIVELEVEVDIMLVGKMIEDRTIADTRATHEQMAAFTRRYLAEKKTV